MMKIIDLLGVKGKKIDIIPTTRGCKITEVYNKKFEFLCVLVFDTRKKYNKFVMINLDKDMMMSRDCINEAFDLTEKYWKNKESD